MTFKKNTHYKGNRKWKQTGWGFPRVQKFEKCCIIWQFLELKKTSSFWVDSIFDMIEVSY